MTSGDEEWNARLEPVSLVHALCYFKVMRKAFTSSSS